MHIPGRLAATLFASLAAVFVAGCSATADAPPPAPEGRLRTSPIRVVPAPDGAQHVSLVVAPGQGSERPAEVRVYVNGHAVAEENVRSHRASASLVVLVDDSAEMEARGLSPVANGLLQALASGVDPHADRITAMRFNDEVTLRYDYSSPLSLIKRRGLRLEPSGNRCLNLALDSAVAAAAASPLPARSVLVATSGEDAGGTCGGSDRDSVISTAASVGVPIHIVHLGPAPEKMVGLERLAADTGGSYWVLGTTDSLDALATQVAALLVGNQLVSFRTDAADKDLELDVRAMAGGTPLAGALSVRPSDAGPQFTTLVAHNNFGEPASAVAAAPAAGEPAAEPNTGQPAVAASVAAAPAAATASSGQGRMNTLLGIVAGVIAIEVLMRRRRLRRIADVPSALAAVRARAEADRLASAEASSTARQTSLEESLAQSAEMEEASRASQPTHISEIEDAPGHQLQPGEYDATSVNGTVPSGDPEPSAADAPRMRIGPAAATVPLASTNGNGAHPTDVSSAPVARADRRDMPATPSTTPPAPVEPAPYSLVGFVCGRYRLESPLGRGGLGEVYRARDLQFDRTVAVKVLYDTVFEGADAFDSLMREVSLVDRITHMNVVRVYDVIRFEGRVAIVMEFVSGQSLAAITREQGTVSPEDFDAVLTGVAEALDAAHAAGVVHGDVTPGNVLITDEGKVKLCDFGVGRLVGDDPSAPRAGTPRFVAPEVLAGADAGPGADIYSLGALTLHVLAGRDADLTALTAPYSRALEGALEPDPNMRCVSAGALAVAFHAAVEEDLLRRRGPVRRLVDGFRLRSRRSHSPTNRVDLPSTVTFPMLQENRDASAFLEDPDRTQPLPTPGEGYMASVAPGVTQPLGPRK